MMFAALLAAIIGLRGWALYFATITMWIPICILGTILAKRLFPPKIELYRPQDLTLFPR